MKIRYAVNCIRSVLCWCGIFVKIKTYLLPLKRIAKNILSLYAHNLNTSQLKIERCIKI